MIAAPPPRRVAGHSRRAVYQSPRSRKLTVDQEAAIRALAATRSLRSLAADFDVSHEAIRQVLRATEPIKVAKDHEESYPVIPTAGSKRRPLGIGRPDI